MTPSPLRPRTLLDVPGHSERKLLRALGSEADALMMDLEDGVPAHDEDKRAARDTIARMVGASSSRQTLLVRVNEVGSAWFADDVRMAVRCGLHGVVVPKMETLDELRTAARLLDELDAPPAFGIWAIVESPAMLLALERGDSLPPRLQALICGVVDFLLQLTPRAFLHPLGLDAPAVRERAAAIRQRVLLAARAARCRAVDAIVIPAITDTQLAAQDAARARDAGFDTTIVLHPAQIVPANAAFDLSPQELATANAALEVGRNAAAQARTSALVDGRVVLPQHVKAARHFLQDGEATA